MQSLAKEVLEFDDVNDAERVVLKLMRAQFPEHLDHGGGQRLAAEDDISGPAVEGRT